MSVSPSHLLGEISDLCAHIARLKCENKRLREGLERIERGMSTPFNCATARQIASDALQNEYPEKAKP